MWIEIGVFFIMVFFRTHVSFLVKGRSPAQVSLCRSSRLWGLTLLLSPNSPLAGLPQWLEWVQMSITLRTWISKSFISATTYDIGQEPMSFSKIVMCFMVAQFFLMSILVWPGQGQFWQMTVGKQCKHGEGTATSSVFCPRDNPFTSAPSPRTRTKFTSHDSG